MYIGPDFLGNKGVMYIYRRISIYDTDIHA